MDPKMDNAIHFYNAADLPIELGVTRAVLQYRLKKGMDPNLAYVSEKCCRQEQIIQVNGLAVRVIPRTDVAPSIIRLGVAQEKAKE